MDFKKALTGGYGPDDEYRGDVSGRGESTLSRGDFSGRGERGI